MSTTTLQDYAVAAPPRARASRIPFVILRAETAALLLLLALCATLRLVNLGAFPVFIDEGTYAQAARIVGAHPGPDTFFIQSARNFGFNPPLFSWLAAPFTRLMADPLLAARLASALIGTVGMVVTWAVGRTLWGPLAGLLAGLFYALSPFVLFYNRMAMLDGLLAVCGAGALLFALRLARGAHAVDALGLGLCLAAGMLTKLFAVNLLLLPLLAVAVAPRGRRAVTLRGAALALALGLLPLLYLYQDGAGLHGHLNTRDLAQTLRVVWEQVARWADGLWRYVTPPVLLCTFAGLWAVRRERLGLMVGLWALLGTLAVVATPNTIFAPRYVLYIAVPLVLLAARGLLLLGDALRARSRLGGRAPLWLLLAVATALVSIPAVAADARTISAPLQTTLIPYDRWQYATGWPSGRTLAPAAAYLRQQAARRPITVVAEDIPLYMLQVSLYDDKNITWDEANFGRLTGLRNTLKHALRTTGPAGVYVVNHHTTGRHPDRRLQPKGYALLPDRALAVVVTSRGPDGANIYEVYKIVPRRAHCETKYLFGVKTLSCT